ncbi:MAG: hypothetical protein ABH883_00990 [Candidatus Omnitrophota bacterium]
MKTLLAVMERRSIRKKNQKGMVLVLVLLFASLTTMLTLLMGNMVVQDMHLISRIKSTSQALYLAEAGINNAFARMKNENFGARSPFSVNLDTGSYSVTFSKKGGRFLITSVGTSGGVSRTVSAEVKDNTPGAMRCVCAAGNDIRINAFISGDRLNGDIHANHDIYLTAGPLFASLSITGKVSASGIVKEGSKYHQADGLFGGFLDLNVYINGQGSDRADVYEYEPRKIFPTFNYEKYKQQAQASGDYYDTDQNFNGVSLSPSNGIVFIDGNVTFSGNCTLNGGIVADSIRVLGTLTQKKSGTRNVIITREGDIGVIGRLATEEAVVYAGRDIVSLEVLADLDVKGVLMARRDIYMWTFITIIDYVYVESYPSDMGGEYSQPFEIVSWNR